MNAPSATSAVLNPAELLTVSARTQLWPTIRFRSIQRGLSVVAWTGISFLTAALSYLLGMSAILFGILSRMEASGTLWPALICLGLGLLCARGSLACLDRAFPLRERR